MRESGDLWAVGEEFHGGPWLGPKKLSDRVVGRGAQPAYLQEPDADFELLEKDAAAMRDLAEKEQGGLGCGLRDFDFDAIADGEARGEAHGDAAGGDIDGFTRDVTGFGGVIVGKNADDAFHTVRCATIKG